MSKFCRFYLKKIEKIFLNVEICEKCLKKIKNDMSKFNIFFDLVVHFRLNQLNLQGFLLNFDLF